MNLHRTSQSHNASFFVSSVIPQRAPISPCLFKPLALCFFSVYYDCALALLVTCAFVVSLNCRAIKNGKGLHSKKEVPIHRVADISGVGIFLFFSFVWLSYTQGHQDKHVSKCINIIEYC